MAKKNLPKLDPALLAKSMPYVTAVTALLYVAVVYFYLLAPKLARLRPGGEYDPTPFTTRIESERQYTSSIANATKEFNLVDKALRQRIENSVTAEPDIPELYVQMDTIAKANGFQLMTVEASPDTQTVLTGNRKAVRITASLEGGGYQQYKRLVSDLERLERIIDLQSVTFTAGSGSYSLVMLAYYLDPTVLAPPVATSAQGLPGTLGMPGAPGMMPPPLQP